MAGQVPQAILDALVKAEDSAQEARDKDDLHVAALSSRDVAVAEEIRTGDAALLAHQRTTEDAQALIDAVKREFNLP